MKTRPAGYGRCIGQTSRALRPETAGKFLPHSEKEALLGLSTVSAPTHTAPNRRRIALVTQHRIDAPALTLP